MTRLRLMALAGAVLVGVAACGKSTPVTLTTSPTVDHGTVTATINGVLWTGAVDVARSDANGLVVEGRGSGSIFGQGDTITIDIQGQLTSTGGTPLLGLHDVTAVADIGQVLVADLKGTTVLNRWSAGRGSGTGSWTLQAITSTDASGVFGVTAPSADGLQTTVTVSLGTFNATFF